ncbi:hypothetical protein [Flavisolibacter nicotianae]|uniref:hypothetical protein n=1 Tax=Flavisolibacter nicotianae TaxID=2364882 RepID=UPI0013C52221|nr:hypothetical protein [Flavisolibacter nicotianae]
MGSLNAGRPFFLFFLLCFLLLQATPGRTQVYGCKDPTAVNYNAAATVNDGSCTYSTTSYTPPVKVDPLSSVLQEGSGLQMAGDFLWSFNDGGGAAAIYRIDTLTNAILQTVNLEGATNVDWEDIAFDGTYFYVGDVGNNASGNRQDLKIYKFRLSDIPDYATNAVVTIPSTQIDVINFTYSDQPQPPVAAAPNNTRFDCEALIVDEGKIHLFTKNWVDVNTVHYVINGTAAGSYVASPVETLSTGYLVTAADKAPGTNLIALLGYQASGTGNHFLHLLSDYSGGLYFNGNKRLINLPSAAEMGQAEGLAFRNTSYGYISNEYFTKTVLSINITVDQKLRSFNVNNLVPGYVLSQGLKHFAAVKGNGANELSWDFTSPVKELKLQYSANRVDFSTIQSFATSASGTFSHSLSTAVSCYRLSWKDANGMDRYSDVVCLKNDVKKSLSHIVLRSNGELSFTWSGEQPARYVFRLLATDGRLLAQTGQQVVSPGANTLRLATRPGHNAVLLLQASGDGARQSSLLRVD